MSFSSRMQLAAALLEYDNDDDPSSLRPKVSHRDSAMFRPYRAKPLDDWQPPGSEEQARRRGLQPSPVPSSYDYPMYGPYPSMSKRGSQHLDVGRQAGVYDRNTASSSSDPRDFGQSGAYDGFRGSASSGQPCQSDLMAGRRGGDRVDVSEWGIPHLSPSAEPSSSLPNDDDPLDPQGHAPSPAALESFAGPSQPLPPLQTIGISVPEPTSSPLIEQAASIHLDVVDGMQGESPRPLSTSKMDGSDHLEVLGDPVDEVLRYSEKVRAMVEQGLRSPHMIPLPPSPAAFHPSTLSRPTSALSLTGFNSQMGDEDTATIRETWSTNIQPTFHDEDEDEIEESDQEPNPFALPPPPPELASRFDPKHQRQHSSLSGTLSRSDSRYSRRMSDGELDLADLPHRPDMKQRTMSTSSVSQLTQQVVESERPISRVWDDIPTAEEFGRPLKPNRYSTNFTHMKKQSITRPQTLIMPRSLSGLPPPSPPKENVPDGFTLGEKPLPPGSRSSILSPGRPGLPLSLSQKTFRSSLMVDGKREEKEYFVGSAPHDGEYGVGVEEDFPPSPDTPQEKRPGKLYGTSLMDQLEARKAAMRNKQRVFTGDSRPAMMARNSARNSQAEPSPGLPKSFTTADIPSEASTDRRHTLLHLDQNIAVDAAPQSGPKDRISKSRSVFGVDQIWEKEMIKLRVIQEAEARAAAEQATKDALEGKSKRGKGKGKGRASLVIGTAAEQEKIDSALQTDTERRDVEDHPMISPIKRLPDGPPRLSYSPTTAIPKTASPLYKDGPRKPAVSRNESGWSSDEDENGLPKRKPMSKMTVQGAKLAVGHAGDTEDSSDDDVPLSKIGASTSQLKLPACEFDGDSDPEEDMPLSKMKTSKSNALPTNVTQPTMTSSALEIDGRNFSGGSLGLDIPGLAPNTDSGEMKNGPANDRDDDVPLALRQSFLAPQDVDDDVPLGVRQSMISPNLPPQSFANYGPWDPSMYPPQMNPYAAQSPGHWGVPSPMSMYGTINYYPSYPSMPNLPSYPSFNQLPPPQFPPPQFGGHFAPPNPMGYSNQGQMTYNDYMTTRPPPPPASAVKEIDNWRKEVATAPVGSSDGIATGARNSVASTT